MRMNASRLSPDLARLSAELQRGLARGASRVAEYLLNVAGSTRAFTDRTGRARASLYHGVRSPLAHFVRAGGREAPWVKFLEDGTRAHVIRPRRFGTVSSNRSARSQGNMPSLLRFQIAGRWVAARQVKHPGTKATHFMQNARDAAEAASERMLESELNGVITR